MFKLSIFSKIFKKQKQTGDKKVAENFLSDITVDNIKSIEININFLGSMWLAKNYKSSGDKYQKFGNHEHFYHRKNLQQNGALTWDFVVSGPSQFDINPTLKFLKKDAEKVFKGVITGIRSHETLHYGPTISINIMGHSRGGVIAKLIHDWMKSDLSKNNNIKLETLSLTDSYAGPFNKLNKAMANFDKKRGKSIDDTISSTHSMTVLTANEYRFRDPAKYLTANTLIITNATHDLAKFVMYWAREELKGQKGVYICALKDSKHSNKALSDLQGDIGDTYGVEDLVNEFKEHTSGLEKITSSNIDNILYGVGIYRDFSYNNLASDGRRKLFYKILANINQQCHDSVIKFLMFEKDGPKTNDNEKGALAKIFEFLDGKSSRKSMAEKVEKNYQKFQSKNKR